MLQRCLQTFEIERLSPRRILIELPSAKLVSKTLKFDENILRSLEANLLISEGHN